MKKGFFAILAVLTVLAMVSVGCDTGSSPSNNNGPFKVTFDADGGSSTPAVQTVAKGAKATAPTGITKAGNTLDGWYSGTKKWDFATDTVTADVTLKAKWTAIPAGSFAVTFDTDGGTPAVPAQTVVSGAKATEPTGVTKADHTLDGWYNGATKWNFGTDTVTDNVTLKAKWTEDSVVVEPEEGLTITVAEVEKKVEVIGEGGTVELNAAETGYTFTKSLDYEKSYAYFAVNLGTDKFNDFEKIKFVYQGVSGDIGYKNIFLLASDTAFSGDLGGPGVAAATISDQKQMNGTGENDVTLTITRTIATGFTGSKIYLCLYINAKAADGGADTVFKISDIELVKSDTPFVPVKITELTIPSVRAPVEGQAPVLTLSNVQYTGAVTWLPAVTDAFTQGTTYTATIALTAKTGYTFNGVDANAFTVTGATGATSAAGTTDTMEITATFPATPSSVPEKIITFTADEVKATNGSVVLEAGGNGFSFTGTQGNEYAFAYFKVTFASSITLSKYTKISYKITGSGGDATYKSFYINAFESDTGLTTAPLAKTNEIGAANGWSAAGVGNKDQEYPHTVGLKTPLPSGTDLNEVWIVFYSAAPAGNTFKVTDIKFHN